MILDTCALLFLASGDRRLSKNARQRLSTAPLRRFCAISSFEIALKWQQGKLELPVPPSVWIRDRVSRYGLTEIPLDSAVCVAAATLPPHHRDPFDRFSIACALQLCAPVVTVDPKFIPYGIEVLNREFAFNATTPTADSYIALAHELAEARAVHAATADILRIIKLRDRHPASVRGDRRVLPPTIRRRPCRRVAVAG